MKGTHMMPLCRHAFYTKCETRLDTDVEETPQVSTENVKITKTSKQSTKILAKEVRIDSKKIVNSSPGINSESPSVPANYDMGQESKNS